MARNYVLKKATFYKNFIKVCYNYDKVVDNVKLKYWIAVIIALLGFFLIAMGIIKMNMPEPKPDIPKEDPLIVPENKVGLWQLASSSSSLSYKEYEKDAISIEYFYIRNETQVDWYYMDPETKTVLVKENLYYQIIDNTLMLSLSNQFVEGSLYISESNPAIAKKLEQFDTEITIHNYYDDSSQNVSKYRYLGTKEISDVLVEKQ